MKRIAIVLLLLMACMGARAAEGPYADKAFMEIVSWLKSVDRYSYELTIRSEMKANPKDAQEQHSTIYTSNADFIRYINGGLDCSFLNKQGMFKVNYKSREATYKQFNSEKMAARVMAAAAVPDAGRLLDSVLFDKASITSKRKTGDILEYKLSYEKGYIIKSLDLRFDAKNKLLLSVSYVVERYMNGIRRDAALVHQVVTMKNYKAGPPAELEAVLSNSNDLNSYLHTAYAGYNIHNL